MFVGFVGHDRNARSELRKILHNFYDNEFTQRCPGTRIEPQRRPLNCIGPYHQLHVDGHEKLNHQALNLGPITLPIYGAKDQFGSAIMLLIVAPSVRLW